MLSNILLKMKKVFDNPFIVVGGITLFGALLRLYHLGFKPLWFDEAVLYLISNSGDVQNIIAQNALQNSAPPLFAILLNLTLKIGDSETVLRLFPWLGGVAAVPAIYFLARQFIERPIAYFLSFLVAFAVTPIDFSQQLREYSLTFLMATIILTLFYRQLRSPTWINLAFMTLAMVVGTFLQYGLALLILALNFICAIELLFAKENRKALLLKWSVSQFIVLCAVVAVYYLSLKQQMVVGFGSTSTVGYLSDSYWDGSIRSILSLSITNTQNIFDFTFPGALFLFVAVIGFIFTLQDRRNYIALMMFTVPMILTFVAACARLYPYQGGKQDTFLAPMIYVLFGFGLSHLLNMIRQRWVVLVLLLIITITGLQTTRSYLKSPGGENMRPVATTLSELFEDGDKIYVYYSAKPAFIYYYRDHLDSQIFGRESRGNPDGYLREIDSLLLSNNRVWIVFSHCYADECEIIPKYISEKRKVELVVSDKDAWLYIVR